jgi:hypothetical protein
MHGQACQACFRLFGGMCNLVGSTLTRFNRSFRLRVSARHYGFGTLVDCLSNIFSHFDPLPPAAAGLYCCIWLMCWL